MSYSDFLYGADEWRWWVPDELEERESRKVMAFDADGAAESAAEWFYDNCDGWENTWPVTFRVRHVKTGKVWDVSVGMEHQPSFHSTDSKEIE